MSNLFIVLGEIRVSGDELRWKFTVDAGLNGWGWRFTVYPSAPSSIPNDNLSDSIILYRPSVDLVQCLLGEFPTTESTEASQCSLQ